MRIWSSLWRTVGSIALAMAFVAIFFRPSPIQAQSAPPNDQRIGPELGFFDQGNQRDVFENVVLANNHTGTVQVANEITEDPYNPAPGTHVVLRVTGIQPDTSINTVRQYANKLRASADLFPAGTIVYLGNELNNLSLEYKYSPEPAANDAAALNRAGRDYGRQFNEFSAALAGSGFRVAPGPPDLYNGLWDPNPWLQGFFSSFNNCGGVDVLVVSIFDGVTPRITGASDSLYGVVDAYERVWANHGCAKRVVHLAGIGVDPNVQPPISLADQVQFNDDFELREGIESAATLMLDPCENSNVTKSDWLYYIPKGQVYDSSGGDALSSGSGACGERGSRALPLIYPRNESELRPYLANSQVYCAPEQMFVPVATGTSPDLNQCLDATEVSKSGPGTGMVDNDVCSAYEYPIVPVDETWKVPSLSFPLIRGKGGISMETDLSRVNPGETLAQAIENNNRADYAPQFYLTSPEMQCATVENYLNYIAGVCGNYSAKKNSKDKCDQDSKITLPSGGNYRLTELRNLANGFFNTGGDENSQCSNYLARVKEDPIIEEIVRSVAPRAPKTFKMGFFVEHTYAYGDGNKSLGSRFANTMMTMWFNVYTRFSGREPDKSSLKVFEDFLEERPSERVTITPVWYNAGFAATPFDDHQTDAPFAINPMGTKEDAEQATYYQDPAKFMGPIWSTYAPVLTPETQQAIARKRSQWVTGNNILLGDAFNHLGTTQGVSLILGFPEYMIEPGSPGGPLIECRGKACLCARGDNYQYSGLSAVMQSACQGQTLAELRAAFPQTPPKSPTTPAPTGTTAPTDPEFDPNLTPSNSYLRTLKQWVVARVNAGRQTTRPYREGDKVGPLTVRTMQRCTNEAIQNDYAEKFGQQESAQRINSKAVQPGIQGKVEDVVNYLSAKVIHETRSDARDITGPYSADRVSSAYIVLPDDAVTLESMQEYVTPAFMSPEMYDEVMSGKSVALPFNRDKTETDKPSYLSAMLKTFGLSRDIATEEQGYAQYEEIRYQCRGNVPTTLIPTANGQRTTVWRQYPSEGTTPKCPTPEGIAIAYQPIEKSLVNVQGNVDGVPSNPNPEAPGGLAAVNEYLRRMAFTPLHMQPFSKYPGLEKFYAGKPDPGETAYDPSQIGDQCVYKSHAPLDVWQELREIGSGTDYRPILNTAACQTVIGAGMDVSAGNGGTYGRQLASMLRTILSVEGAAYLNAAASGGTYQCQPNQFGVVGPMSLTVGQCAAPGQASANYGLERNTLTPDICTLRGALQSSLSKIQGDFQAGMQQAQALTNLQPVAGISNGSSPAQQQERRRLYAAYELAAESYLGRGACGCMSFNRTNPGCSEDYGSDGLYAYTSDDGAANDYCQYVAQTAMGAFENICSGF